MLFTSAVIGQSTLNHEALLYTSQHSPYLLDSKVPCLGTCDVRSFYTPYSEHPVELNHRQRKLNIREPLSYKDLYGKTTDLCKMVETNIVLSIKSTYLTAYCILCHLPLADSKRFR